MSQRCQHSGPRGQCNKPAVDGSDFCLTHCNEADRIRAYRLTDPNLRRRFDEMSSSTTLETVRAEIDLFRTLMEERVNIAKTEAEKIVLFQQMPSAMAALNKLVDSFTKLERQSHEVLGKGSLNKLADEIAVILIEELTAIGEDYTNIVDAVAGRIAGVIAEARNEEAA